MNSIQERRLDKLEQAVSPDNCIGVVTFAPGQNHEEAARIAKLPEGRPVILIPCKVE